MTEKQQPMAASRAPEMQIQINTAMQALKMQRDAALAREVELCVSLALLQARVAECQALVAERDTQIADLCKQLTETKINRTSANDCAPTR